MPITLSDFLTFPFNGGKGIRTNQLDGKIGVDQVVDALRDGSIILADTDGNLPDPADNQGRFALTDSGISVSRNHPADAVVTFKLFGPDRVVASGEPAISSKEMQYAGSFPNTESLPPIADYSVGAYLWSVSAQNWFHKDSTLQTAWRQSNHPGAPLVYNNFIYGTLEEAANHVHGVGNWQPNGNSVAIIGHGNSQVAYVLTAYTAPSNDNWQWDHLGISQADILAIVDQHNASGTAHQDIRSDVSTVEDRLDALDPVEIEAYDSTATYSRGSANSIVTHSSGLFIYISSTERSSGHDPDTQPGYWLDLSEGVTYMVISSGSHRIAARTLVVDGATDQVYLCTTTQTTPRDLTYIKAQADTIGGTFIELTAMIATTWKGPHVIGQDYEAGDRVTTNANTRIYTARVDTGETPPHADWIQVGPVGSGGGSDLAVQEEGTEVASAATSLNFTGSGATATASNGAVTVDIPGGQAGSLDDGSVTTAKLADGSVTTPKLADDAVTGAKIADATIHGGALIDGTIATGKIGDDQVTGAKLSANAVSTGKVADDAITQAKIADDAVDTDQIADSAVTSAKLAANAAGDGKVPIDDTLQFDGSGDLGVNTQRVVQTVSEWVQHFASGSAHDTSGHSGKYQEYTSSNVVRRVGSVQYDFTPGNSGGTRTYQVFIVELTGRNIDVILGSSEVYSGNNLQHRFHFEDGVTINPNVRIGIGLHRTDGGNNEALSVRFGTESQDSPRESYDDASEDFNFVGRFNHDRPTPTVNDTVGGTTAGQIYGNPEIFYQIIHTHESLVGDGNVTAAHISSGSADDGEVLTADGSGGAAFEALPDSGLSESDVDARVQAGVLDFAETGNTDDVPVSKIPGGITHIESGATYNNNVITVSTTGTVRGGDGILFAVPSPFGTSATQAVSLAIDGQSNSEHPLHDRNGDALHEDDLDAGSVYIAISDADSWDILFLPDATGSGSGTTVEANPSGSDGDDLTRITIDGTNYNVGTIPWGFQVDTQLVPELNQDAITTARLVLEDSGLTHYLTFKGWTQANLDTISHLPVGAHIGLRQGTTTRVLRVETVWDATNNRYQVINVNTGILTEAASGTATELLLTAAAGGGTVYTTGTAFPSNPLSGQLFEFNGSAASITAKDYDGTVDVTSAVRGDLFKYDSTATNWVKQSAISSETDLKGQAVASITFGATPTSGSSLETSASGSGTRLDSGDIGGTGSDVGWVRDTNAPTAFTVERIGASSDEPIINVPHTRPTTDSLGYLVELDVLPHLGTLSNAISDSATSIIFTAESTETLAVGDDLRIESETVTVDAIPADGATGVAARTYGISRGEDGTTAVAHTNTRMIQRNEYELESDGIILQGGPSPQQGGSNSRSTVSLGTGALTDATGIRELGVRLVSERSTVGVSGLEQTRLIDLITQGDNAVLLPSTRITVYLAVIGGGGDGEAGQESPAAEGIAQLTADLVTATLYKWVETTDGKPADPGAHWRFDDEWDGTTPQSSDGGGWYTSRADALDNADNNPDFSEDTWTLWIATEMTRRRVVNEEYTYTDEGYTVTAAWDIQYSTDGVTWVSTEPDLNKYIRYRDQDTGEFGPTIPVGTDVGNNDWLAIRTTDLVYPGGSNEDELGAAYDFGNFSELLFVVAGYRLITVTEDGEDMQVAVTGPRHQCVVSRGAGWPIADASDGEDNNDEDDGPCFQFTYFATNTGVGLLVWERGDDVNFGNPPFLQNAGEPPTQLGGHFKIVSTDGAEAHVTKFRFFDFSHDYARTTMSIFARYR